MQSTRQEVLLLLLHSLVLLGYYQNISYPTPLMCTAFAYPTHFTCIKTVTHPPDFSRSPPTPTPLCNDQSLSSNLLDIEKSVIVFQWDQNWGYYCAPPSHFLVHILQGTCDFFFHSIVPFVSIIQLEGVLDSYKIKELYILRFLVSLAWTCVLGAWG